MLLAGAAACALWAASSAEAATVTVGSPMTMPATGTSLCGAACTWANTALGESGANVTSPISGTIVRWRLAGGSTGGPFELRVIRPAGGGLYTGAGTSSPAQPVGSGVQTFLTTNLPIQAGDLIGIDEPSGSGVPRFTPPTSTLSAWSPALPDGTTAMAPSSTYPGYESLFNADVESDTDQDGFGDETQDDCVGVAGPYNGCSSTVTIDGVSRQGRTAVIVTATVPGRGRLSAGAANDPTVLAADAKKKKKKKKKRTIIALTPAGQTVTAKSPQMVSLTLALTRAAKKQLKRKGKLGIQVKATYTPTGGPSATQLSQVKLKKKCKRHRRRSHGRCVKKHGR